MSLPSCFSSRPSFFPPSVSSILPTNVTHYISEGIGVEFACIFSTFVPIYKSFSALEDEGSRHKNSEMEIPRIEIQKIWLKVWVGMAVFRCFFELVLKPTFEWLPFSLLARIELACVISLIAIACSLFDFLLFKKQR